MAYDIIPKTKAELLNINNGEVLLSLYEKIVNNYKIHNPFSFDATRPNKVKIIRSLCYIINLDEIDVYPWDISFGNGSRANGGKGNIGNLYETELYDAILKYISPDGYTGEHAKTICDISSLINKEYAIIGASLDGDLNQKRPLNITDTSIIIGNEDSLYIGPIVTDITLLTDAAVNNKVYLSLKYGKTVSLVNSGITKYMPSNEIKAGLITNTKGLALLDLLCIDNERLCSVFNNYTSNSKGGVDVVDITNNIKNNSVFNTFIKSVIGYGYILVHKIGKDTHVLNISKELLDDMVYVTDASIRYPMNGSAKRVDVNINMKGINVKLVIRNKSGGIYPSHIIADYTLNK